MLELNTPAQYVKGIGPRLAEVVATKGITTVEDLLYYLPFRYEDRLNPRRIGELRPGEMASVIAEVRTSALFRTKRMPLFELTVGDPVLGRENPHPFDKVRAGSAAPLRLRSGQAPAGATRVGHPGGEIRVGQPAGLFGAGARAMLKCIWFNGTYLKDRFQPGQLVALYGKVEQSKRGRERLQLINPQFEILDDGDALESIAESTEIGRIVPVYESAGSGKVTSRWFRRVIHGALENLTPDIVDAIPGAVQRRMGLMPRREAFRRAHWPEESAGLEDLQAARTPAQIRLIFEELFFLELGLELKRKRMRALPGIAFGIDDRVREAIKRILPFHPTAAQKRVLKEIAEDMKQPAPMRRLLQGDVGSGKTIVALEAAIIAIENGYQAALMAPTEILATQHYLSARRMLEKAGYRIVLLTGSVEEGRKRDIRRHIAQGNAQLVIGTHALIEEKVEFDNLGLVIVDEQHRFGVMQRLKLMKKALAAEEEQSTVDGRRSMAGTRSTDVATGPQDLQPDTLVMTATPIPRTLALTLYGDLDVSVLDEMPPGRTPIMTRRVGDERAEEVFAFVRKQVAAGHQAYVVYPVIEENEEKEIKAATKMYDEIRRRILPDLRIGLLHGRLDAEQKDEIMQRFQAGQIDVLVSTTVIEVGVDVANATVMVIEHAERFGLAQLHQLRGRIGRGAAKSFCVLVTGGKVTAEAEQRLDTMVRTTDGFEIAETDLQLRGPGEFFGTRQAGLPGFRVANLLRDRELLEAARREAAVVVSGKDPEVSPLEVSRALVHLRSHWQRRYGLVEVG
ncbi:MAG: ATP-dependent DNA helicase RecG [Acidobacteriia bacterium]|nr:ATP-dependent DNA helicase RecG [Terriglobia bacterium]